MSHNPDTEKYVKELQSTWEEYKKTLDSKFAETAEGKEKIEKLDKKLDSLEEANQKMVTERESEKKEADELKEKINLLEKKLYRMPGGIGAEEKSKVMKAFEDFAQKGERLMSKESKQALIDYQKDYLRTDVDPQGGFLVPEEMSDEILKKITEISPMRQICRVKNTSAKSYTQPVRETLVSAGDTAEGEAMTESTSIYGDVEIFCKKMTSKIPLSMEVIEDAAFNMETEVMEDAREEFMRKEGYWFVKGSGPKQAKGLMENATIATTNSGVANSISSDSLITLAGELKFGYDPMYGFNRQTMAVIRKFKDGSGQYLWVPTGTAGLTPGSPNEINGYRYVILQDMDSVGTNTYPVVYGDFRRGYLIIDRRGITMLRDPYSEGDNDKIIFRVTKRTGGDVVMAEAFKKLKCAV